MIPILLCQSNNQIPIRYIEITFLLYIFSVNHSFLYQTTSLQQSFSCSTPCSSFSFKPPVTFKQPLMKKFLDNVSSQEAEKLNILMAEFFYGCNVSFNTADSKYFKNFISALRPAYKPPNRKLIAGWTKYTTK